MTEAQERWWNERQFGGKWRRDGEDGEESENYFPEPLTNGQRLRLPDISANYPTGIHLGRRGRLVTFYRNGDTHFKGLSASISQKAFVSMESLLVWLNEKIPTTAGVRHIFRLPDGKRVREVSDFQPGGHYVVSSVRRLVRGPDYGGGGDRAAGQEAEGTAPQQRQQQPQLNTVAGHMRQSDIRLLAKGDRQYVTKQRRESPTSLDGGAAAAPMRGVRLITVVSNSHRNSREKVLVNPATRLNFEDLLADFSSLLVMSGPPVRALYTAIPPYRRVESFSQLFREFRDHDTFIACGRELTPVELMGQAGRRDDGGASTAATTSVAIEKSPAKLSRLGVEEDWQLYGEKTISE